MRRRAAGVAGGDGEPFDAAVAELGCVAPRTGQRETVDALVAGRDVLMVTRRGHGGSTTGLLAGLTLPGRTLWIPPSAGRSTRPYGEQPVPYPLPLSVNRPRPGPQDAEPDGAEAPSAELDPEVAELDPEVAELGPEAQGGPAQRPVPLARPPGPEDLAAMAEEVATVPEFTFLPPDRLADGSTATPAPRPDALGLVVVDAAHTLDETAAGTVAGAVQELAGRRGAGVRVLAVVAGPADADRRADLAKRLGLDAPVHTGGGYDRAALRLAVRLAPSLPGKRRLVAEIARAAPGPGLVLVSNRSRADALAGVLPALGVRAMAYVPGMRARRLAESQTLYRRRKLDVLVLTPDARPDLGRIPVAFLVHQDPPADLDALYAELGLADRRGKASGSTLLVTPDQLLAATGPLGAYLTTSVCRRAALLDPYGEPVSVPCGRCDGCDARAGSRAWAPTDGPEDVVFTGRHLGLGALDRGPTPATTEMTRADGPQGRGSARAARARSAT